MTEKQSRQTDLTLEEMLAIGEIIKQWDWIFNWGGNCREPKTYYGILYDDTVGDIGISIGFSIAGVCYYDRERDLNITTKLTGYFIEVDNIYVPSVGVLRHHGIRNGYFLGCYDELRIFEKKFRKDGYSDDGFKNDSKLVKLYKRAEKSFNDSCKGKKSYRKANYSQDIVKEILLEINEKNRNYILEKGRRTILISR